MPSSVPWMTVSGVRSSWVTSARSRRRALSVSSSRALMALKARASERTSRGPRSSTRVLKSPASTRPAASIRSPTGAASAAHAGAEDRRRGRPGPGAPGRRMSAADGRPPSRPSDACRSSNATKRPASDQDDRTRKKQPMRHMKRPAHAPPARPRSVGGQASPSGHQRGRLAARPQRRRRHASVALVRHRPAGSRRRTPSAGSADRAGIGLDLAADVLDVGVDRPLVRLEGDAVDARRAAGRG